MMKIYPISSVNENQAPILPVIMYHAPEKDSILKQFKWIKEHGFVLSHLSDIEVTDYFQDPQPEKYPAKRLVLTFDDAYNSFLTNVLPLLKLKDFDLFKLTLCVPTGDIGDDNREPPWTHGKGALMTWNELEGLRSLKTSTGDDLIEFIPHSVTHRYFDEIELCKDPEMEFRDEVHNSRKMLSDQLNINVDTIDYYCLPGGIGEGKEIVERVLDSEGYIGALRAQYKKADTWSRFRIPRCQPENTMELAKLLSKNGFHCN